MNKKTATSLLVTLGIFATVAPSAEATAGCRDLLAGRPLVQLNVWRYYDQEDFSSALHIHLGRNDKAKTYRVEHMGHALTSGYHPLGFDSVMYYEMPHRAFINPLRAELESGAEGDTAFERIQHYSLKLMEKVRYLDPASRKDQVKTSLGLKTNQVTLFEATEQRRESELLQEYGRIPETARRDSNANSWADFMGMFEHFDETPPKVDPVYEVKVGVSWLISGQDLDARLPLPLESPTLIQQLDRNRYPLVWELGRAGQTKDAAFEETLRASSYMANVELIITGGEIKDAYVLAHSLDAVHTRLYRSKFGMAPLSKYNHNPKEVALIAPLEEFTRRYPLQSYSSSVADLMAASKGSLLPRAALEAVLKMRELRTFYLSSTRHESIQVRDFSNVQAPSLHRKIQSLVMPAYEKAQLLHVLWEYEPIYEFRDTIGDYARASLQMASAPITGIYADQDSRKDRNGLQRLRDFLSSQNAVEVTRASDSRHGPIQALTQTYLYMERRLREAQIEDPQSWMTAAKIHFCLTTEEPRDIAILRDLRPDHVWHLFRAEMTSSMGFGFSRFNYVAVPEIHIESLCFTAERMAELLSSQTQQVEPFELGLEHKRQFLSNPQLYAP